MGKAINLGKIEKKKENELESFCQRLLNPSRFLNGEVEKDNPLTRDLLTVLKKWKVYGAFILKYKFQSLSNGYRRGRLLETFGFLTIGDILFRTNHYAKGNNNFIKLMSLLDGMITINDDYKEGKTLFNSTLKKEKILECYAKEYFKDKKLHVKHNRLYYQILGGIIGMLIGTSLFLSIIYFVWGVSTFIALLLFTFIYFCITLPTLYNLIDVKRFI